MTQNNEEVQTDLLLMTNNSAQGIPSEEPQSMSNTIENTGVSEEFPSLVSSTFQQDNIPINAQTNEYDKKDKTCTKIMDDITLRIYFSKGFLKATNADRPSLQSSKTDITPKKATTVNMQGQNLLLNIYFPECHSMNRR